MLDYCAIVVGKEDSWVVFVLGWTGSLLGCRRSLLLECSWKMAAWNLLSKHGWAVWFLSGPLPKLLGFQVIKARTDFISGLDF